MHPITIIGTGLAGYTTARELRKLDKNLPLRLISQDDGVFYSKPMLSNALAQNKTPEKLTTSTANEMATQLDAEVLSKQAVTQLLPAEQTVLLEETRLHYSQLVLALGAEQLRVPLAGDGIEEVLRINSLEDYRCFRHVLEAKQIRHITIMGAGLIGCEFANDLRRANIAVSVLDLADYPLSRLMPVAAGMVLQQRLAELGVEWFFGVSAQRIDKIATGYQVQLSDNRCIDTNLVLSAIGLRPRTVLAQAAGITTQRGIVVDKRLQTNVTDIYALGDCAEVQSLVLPYVMPLMAAARTLAKILAGQEATLTYPAMPVVVKTPDCPTVLSPPAANSVGEWQVEVDGNDVKALFTNAEGALLGFVLMGSAVKEKQALTKRLPALLT